MNPPVMLIEDTRVAIAASEVAVLLGNTPPPINTSPPAAVIPDIALVTDIRGEWRAGVTPQTTLYPITPAKEKVVTMVAKAGFGEAIPKARSEPKPAVTQT